MFGKNKTVLIVDDEPMSVKILSHQLESDYAIIMAHSGREALEVIAHTKPDIILLDLIMPDMGGYEAYKAIRMLPDFDDVPVLFITVLADVECEAEGLEMGANDYIHKPFNTSLVQLRVKNHLAFSQERSLLRRRSAELQRLNVKLEEEVAQRTAIQSINEELINKLEKALEQVKQLEGIIPICSYCHKIRDDRDSWHRLEDYLTEHSEASFSHGACPDCMAEQMKIIENI